MIRSEIESLINRLQAEMESRQQIVKDCNERIERLKPVYEELGEIKDSFCKERESTKAVFEEKGKWQGDKYTAFCNAGDSLDGTLGDYYKRLDEAQDAVNTEIGNLEAKKADQIPLIGHLLSQIKQLWVDFENAVN